jgi:membrane associated rhomboid family serine protease
MIPVKDNIPLRRFPLVTVALIGADVIVYLLEIRHGGGFFGGPARHFGEKYGVVPSALIHHGRHLQTVLASIFMHASFVHLLVDVIALAIFAANVEDAVGRARFLVFYVLAGVLALGISALLGASSAVPLVAGSVPVAAVLGAYLRLYPRARVISLVLVPFFATIVEIPAVLLIALWLLAQLWLSLAGLTSSMSGAWAVSCAGVLSGALCGLVLIGPLVDAALLSSKRRPSPSRPVY